ncbi:hypothetical protein DPEC_G00312500 [Dallia pectoralis]|uniref:Uncharacterized protein n=1 Tax=Dallia pectoralis TaxID=75939 RepID=A0ACC2FBR0_DALPE|nr:hypothetical protein DPEC_G00312500 [Dallia pectoralis]
MLLLDAADNAAVHNCLHLPFEMLATDVTAVNVTYITSFFTVAGPCNFDVMTADHCHPPLPTLLVLREAIHSVALI